MKNISLVSTISFCFLKIHMTKENTSKIGIPNNFIVEFLDKEIQYKQWTYAKFLEETDIAENAHFICASYIYDKEKGRVSMNMLDFFKMIILTEVRKRVSNDNDFKRICFLLSYNEVNTLYIDDNVVVDYDEHLDELMKEYGLSLPILMWEIEPIDDIIPKNILSKIKKFHLERTYRYRNYDFEYMLFLSLYYDYDFYLVIEYSNSMGDSFRGWLKWIRFVEKSFLSRERFTWSLVVIDINSVLSAYNSSIWERYTKKLQVNFKNVLQENEQSIALSVEITEKIRSLLEERKQEWDRLREEGTSTEEIDYSYDLEIAQLEAESALWISLKKTDKKSILINDIYKVMDSWDNATITIQTKEYFPSDMEVIVKSGIQDYDEVDKYSWVHWNTTIKKYKGRKVSVEGVKKIQY